MEGRRRKVFAVTCVDYGDSVDGKARVLGLFNTMEEAHAAMKDDVEYWAKEAETSYEIFPDSASVGDVGDVGEEYRIEEVEVPNEIP